MLNVVVALDAPTDYGPSAELVVSAACEEVIGARRCPAASELEPGAIAAWYAVIHPNDHTLSSVSIEFRDRSAAGVLIEGRSLTFSRADNVKSRLASIGSVIAAMAAAREGAPPKPHPYVTTSPSLTPLRARHVEPTAWSVDIAALLAPTLGGGPDRAGVQLRGVAGDPRGAFGLFSARSAIHPGNPHFAWSTLGAGAGLRIGDPNAHFQLEFSSELVFEWTEVTAKSAVATQSVGHGGFGARVGLNAVWAVFDRSSLLLGLDGTLVSPRLDVAIADEPAERIPNATIGIWLGIRIAL